MMIYVQILIPVKLKPNNLTLPFVKLYESSL